MFCIFAIVSGIAFSGITKDTISSQREKTSIPTAPSPYPTDSTFLKFPNPFFQVNDTIVNTLPEFNVIGRSEYDDEGRTIIYPSKADVKASSNALSLFQKLPLVGLDANPLTQSLTVLGDTPLILINGVPSSVNDLLSLSPNKIQRIEYSINRPGRYGAVEGNGYIRVTLKARNDGGQVSLWGRSALNAVFVDGNLAGAYHHGPSEFKLTYTPSWRNNTRVVDSSSSSYIGDDFRIDLTYMDNNPFNYLTSPVNMRYVFSPNESTLFSATATLGTDPAHRKNFGRYSDSRLGEYGYSGDQTGRSVSGSVDLYFKQEFNSLNSLEAQVMATLSNSSYTRNNDYYYEDGTQNSYITDIRSHRRSLISESVYTHKFRERVTLSAGYQNIISHNTNEYLISDRDAVLTENNNYLYLSASGQVNCLYLSATTGLKFHILHNENVRRRYLRNLSQIQLQWTPPRSFSLGGVLQYRVGLPSLSALTDEPQQISPYLIFNGNPSIKPSESIGARIVVTYRHNIFSISGMFTASIVHNQTYMDVSYLGDGLFLNRSENLRSSDSMSGRLIFRLNELKGFGASAMLNFIHYRNRLRNQNLSLDSWGGNINLWYMTGKFVFNYWRKFPMSSLQGTVVVKEENGDALGIDYKPDSKLTIGVQWMYMFSPLGASYPTRDLSEINPAVTERFIHNSGNMVLLSITYHADFGKIFRTSRRTLNNVDTDSGILRY